MANQRCGVMMRTRDGLGVFWLPGHEEDALSGRLQFDPPGGVIKLSLVGTFDNAPADDREAKLRIIGWLGNDKVTLDQCFSSGPTIRSPGIAEIKYYANQMFIGHHFELDDLAFQSATVALSDLDSWVSRSGITEEKDYLRDRHAPNTMYTMSFTPLSEESHSFSRGRATLRFAWKHHGDPIHGIRFQQWPVIRIEYDEMQAFNIIQRDLGRIQNLVTLCIDAPTTVDSMVLRRPDIQAKLLSGEDAGEEQAIEFLAPPIRYVDPQERKPRHWHQMLLSYDELGGIATIARWLDTSQGFQRALDSFMSIRHAKHMFTENRFLNVTFAAEAFHRTTQDAPHMDEQTFTRLLGVYLENTPQQHHDWLKGKIRNEPPLRKRLQQLAARSAAATQPLIGEKSRWAHTLSQVRNELSHLGDDSQTFDGSDLHFLAESVYAVVRICMLMECGVPPETLAKKANSQTMTWYQERLRETIERVQKQLANHQ